MADKTWKAFERAVAHFFGCKRTGPMQPKDATDINHDLIHCQCKHSKRHSIVNVWDRAKAAAKGKIPIVAVKVKGRHGFWVLVHSSDLTAVSNQREVARNKQLDDAVEIL